MTASDLYSLSLATLVATRKKMLSPEWQEALDGQSADLRSAASMDLIQVQMAISALSNAVLSDIADEMSDESQAIQDATDGLNKALENISKVQNVISAVTTVLDTVSKFITLV